jgi:hypothetical protein
MLKRQHKFIPIVIVAVLLPHLIAWAGLITDAKKAIQSQYDRSNLAITRKDTTNLFAIFSPEFVAQDTKGHKYKLADLRQQAQKLFDQARSISGTSKIIAITVKSNTALVRVTEHSIMIGNDPSTKTDSTVIMDSVSEDVWVLTSGQWLQTKSKAITAKTTLNGRPFE